jgi:prevent-host-death family protein
MRSIQISTDVVSVGEFKVHASRILRQVHKERRPVVITQHGKPSCVLVSPEDFDRLADRARFIEAVEQGLDDVSAGRVVDDKDLGTELDAVFDPAKPPRSQGARAGRTSARRLPTARVSPRSRPPDPGPASSR